MPNTEVYYEDAKDTSTLKQLIHIWKHDDFFGSMVAEQSKLSTLSNICLGEKTKLINM